jgi:hypothetical protein
MPRSSGVLGRDLQLGTLEGGSGKGSSLPVTRPLLLSLDQGSFFSPPPKKKVVTWFPWGREPAVGEGVSFFLLFVVVLKQHLLLYG